MNTVMNTIDEYYTRYAIPITYKTQNTCDRP